MEEVYDISRTIDSEDDSAGTFKLGCSHTGCMPLHANIPCRQALVAYSDGAILFEGTWCATFYKRLNQSNVSFILLLLKIISWFYFWTFLAGMLLRQMAMSLPSCSHCFYNRMPTDRKESNFQLIDKPTDRKRSNFQ